MAGSLSLAPGPAPLVPLRDDLALLPGPAGRDGAPSWTLYDPAANRYVRIGWLEFEILSRWDLGDPAAVAAAVSAETTIRCTAADVEAVGRFLEGAGLVRPQPGATVARLLAQARAARPGAALWLLKNYLFVRVPLVRPARFLAATLPAVRFVFTGRFALAMLAVLLAGLYLVGRQWDAFTHALPDLFTPQGAVMAALALALSKLLHEAGHAYTATRHGCRVGSMGVALLVLWPVLYTDTTEAWRLVERRKRLEIGAAGMAAELALAAAATLAWGLLPDGPLRAACLVLATTAWVLTLAVNLNPFMRFDGYFLLADWLDEPNLQDRSFALARWRLREWLFGLGEPPPEPLPAPRRHLLVAYGMATWVYRLVLFLGIALLVYHLFFKLLGLFLFAVEIGWFIVRPVVRELAEWMKRRAALRWTRASRRTAVLGAALLVLALLPWRSTVDAPAVLRSETQATLFAPRPARVASVRVREGDTVAAGQPLVVLASPELEQDLRMAGLKARSAAAQVEALSVHGDPGGRMPVLWEEYAAAAADGEALGREARQLTLVAPAAGRVVELAEHLKAGDWVGPKEPLALVADPGAPIVEAYVAEADLGRLAVGQAATFHPASVLEPTVPLVVAAVDRGAVRDLRTVELASVHGGEIAVRQSDGRLVPEEALYRVLLAPDPAAGARAPRAKPGRVSISGERESPAARFLRHALGVLVRESGF